MKTTVNERPVTEYTVTLTLTGSEVASLLYKDGDEMTEAKIGEAVIDALQSHLNYGPADDDIPF